MLAASKVLLQQNILVVTKVVATNMCLSRQAYFLSHHDKSFVATKICHNKGFVMTKMVVAAAPTSDSSQQYDGPAEEASSLQASLLLL